MIEDRLRILELVMQSRCVQSAHQLGRGMPGAQENRLEKISAWLNIGLAVVKAQYLQVTIT